MARRRPEKQQRRRRQPDPHAGHRQSPWSNASSSYRFGIGGSCSGPCSRLALWALDSVRKTPLDAVPDLSDPQVIVYTEWMGRSPDLVEDQITYPLVRALQSTPSVRTVRGYSMFGMSFIYAIFGDGTDIYWARTRVLEQLGRVQQSLPPGATPVLGPIAPVLDGSSSTCWKTRRAASTSPG